MMTHEYACGLMSPSHRQRAKIATNSMLNHSKRTPIPPFYGMPEHAVKSCHLDDN